MQNVDAKKLFIWAMLIAVVIAGIFYYLEKDSAYSALKMLPADADIVFAFDLKSLQDDEMALKVLEEVEDQDWYHVPRDFDWLDVHTLSGAIWLDDRNEPKSGAWVLRGDFDIDTVEDFIKIAKKHGGEAYETEFMGSEAWQIGRNVFVVWIDDGVVALGDEEALEKVIGAYDGDTNTVGDSKKYNDLLDHVDSSASILALGQELPDNRDFPVNAFSMSMDSESEMEMILYLDSKDIDKLENNIDRAIEKAEDHLDNIDTRGLPVPRIHGIKRKHIEKMLDSLKRKDIEKVLDSFANFLESVEIEELDDGLLIEAKTEESLFF